jgi:hypothetical protein
MNWLHVMLMAAVGGFFGAIIVIYLDRRSDD